MVFLRRVPLLAMLVWAWAGAVATAADYAFVFHSGVTASVFDATSLDLIATPNVGANARQAIGVPDPSDPTSFVKIFIINDNAVRVLDAAPPFATIANTPLPKSINFGERAGLLSPDARWMLVAAESTLFIFDAQNPANPAVQLIEMGQQITSISVNPVGTRAYLTVAGSTDVEPVGLSGTTPQRLAGPIILPEIPSAATVAPNGAGLYAASPGLLYDVDLESGTIRDTLTLDNTIPRLFEFDSGAPLKRLMLAHGNRISLVTMETFTLDFGASPPVVVDKLLAPTQDQLFILNRNSQQIVSHVVGGGFDNLRDPRSRTTFRAAAIDMELDLPGDNLFVLYEREDELFRFSADADTFGAVTGVPRDPVGLSILSTTGIAANQIVEYGGADQVAPGGQDLPRPVAFQVTDSNGRQTFGAEVVFSSFEPNVIFDPANATTNRFGIVTTSVRVPNDDEFSIRAQTLTGNVAVVDLNTGAIAEGALTVVSGDYQAVLENTPLPREIQIKTVSSGVALPDTELTITPDNTAVVCPATVETDSKGIATFICTAGETLFSPFPTITRIDVEDTFSRSLAQPLTIRVVENENDLPRNPRKEKRGLIRGVAGGVTTDAIELSLLLVSGFGPVPDVAVEFETDRNVTPIPLIAPSDPFGFIRADLQFGCRRGTGTFKTSLNAPGLPEDEFDYEIVAGPASSMVRLQGNNQIGLAGERLDGPGQALVARVTDSCGNPVGNVPVGWQVTPEGAATLELSTALSNNDGRISTLVRMGQQPGPFSVTASLDGASTTFDLAVEISATQLISISGDGQQLQSGASSQPLVVQVRNDAGTPVENVDVIFAIAQGSGVFSSPSSVTTGSDGRAFVIVQAGNQVGPLVVEAQSIGQTTTFSLTVVGRQPVVSSLGFVNGASFISGWVPGSLGSIFGAGLMEGINGVVQAGFAPFPTELRNVRVLVNGEPAPIISMANVNGQEQINIQVPFATPAPAADIVVTIENNGSSASFSGIRTFIVQPGIFEFTLPEGRFAAALHADFSLVEPANPARPGEVILLFFTGGGPVNPAVATNVAGPIPAAATVNAATVTLGGVLQKSLGSFYAPTGFTLFQVNFRVHPDTPDGNSEVQISQRGTPSPVASIPVKR